MKDLKQILNTKLVELQKKLFLFEVRIIFTKISQVTEIITQNLEPIYKKHRDDKYKFLQHFNGLVNTNFMF